MIKPIYYIFFWIKSIINILKNKNKKIRNLEIGPGSIRIEGYETLNIIPGSLVDYFFDASKKLPFNDNTFDRIYASHILEHIPWYKTVTTLQEWVRILKPGGIIDIWVPDGLKIAKTLYEFEILGVNNIKNDGWYKFNPSKDPCIWASGRLFTFGDGKGNLNHPNWHRSIFTPRYLSKVLNEVGLINISSLDANDVIGYDHGWINLGVRGQKP